MTWPLVEWQNQRYFTHRIYVNLSIWNLLIMPHYNTTILKCVNLKREAEMKWMQQRPVLHTVTESLVAATVVNLSTSQMQLKCVDVLVQVTCSQALLMPMCDCCCITTTTYNNNHNNNYNNKLTLRPSWQNELSELNSLQISITHLCYQFKLGVGKRTGEKVND